ncbi:Helix-turn-helix domain protein [Roseomonas sp. TAS13]|uniref:helix-turn-helix domain-containing protein n=1 Tax=Roseomonas TaxID=125216 RepID=UPI000969097F|nr:helix-turn-helix domain-containing protein [Roseomonas sp. TAS13]GAV35818.1 Helix-turn-helix domain protein [Roseomonas sp. TAS13]
MITPDPGDRLLTLAEVTERLGVSARTLRRWRQRRLLPAIRIAGTVRIRLADFERALAGATPARRSVND